MAWASEDSTSSDLQTSGLLLPHAGAARYHFGTDMRMKLACWQLAMLASIQDPCWH